MNLAISYNSCHLEHLIKLSPAIIKNNSITITLGTLLVNLP
jgi:hypothetical protein